MSLTEADDFLAETRALAALLNGRPPEDFERATGFKGWTVNDVLAHLHFWNLAVDLGGFDVADFERLAAEVASAASSGRLRALEAGRAGARGPELAALWLANAEQMVPRWREIDPKRRVPWMGPSMSARSAMTARQMETWAHGFEVFDLFGVEREESDRLRNIVVLGVNTFGWSHQVHGLPVPPAMPELRLVAPSGAIWTFGDARAGRIAGEARDFAAVVTQTRALADTTLTCEGEIARNWMSRAQCFAGPPETPPAPGSRRRRAA
jgi:uncharacterized protein (TIGR03084 family)